MNVNAWPITTDQIAPDHLPMAVDRVAFAGEIVAVVLARTAAEARDAAELVDVEYEELPGGARPQGGGGRTRCSRTPTSAPTSRRSGSSTPVGRAAAARSTRCIGGGPQRRHRHRAGVPPAAADPGVHGAALDRRRPDRRADHDVVGHPDPAHHPVPARGHHRRARVQDPGDRPRRGRRLRRQAADDARGVDHLVRRSPARQALQVHRDPLGVPGVGPPRPRPVAEAHAGRRPRRAG